MIAAPHSIFRTGLRRLLEGEGGFRVVGEAANGDDALHVVKDVRPDVLLLDLSVPWLMGVEVLRRLPKTTPVLHTVVLTESTDRSETVERLLFGAHGIVSKQSASDRLFKSIRTVMAGELWVSRDVLPGLVEAARRSVRSKFGLTRRELEVTACVVSGHTNKRIAEIFKNSEYTIKHHLTRIFDKVGVTNRMELATFAINHDLVKHLQSPDDEVADRSTHLNPA